MNDDAAERIAKALAAKYAEQLTERQAEQLLGLSGDPLAAFEPRSNPLRDLYIAKYGSEAAADARLAEEARQDAVRAGQVSSVQSPTTEPAGAEAIAAPAHESLQAWKTKDLWSERELQDLCCGRLPDAGRASDAAVNEAAEAIRRAVLARALPVASQPIDATDGDRFYAHARFFAPMAATAWASSRFSAFPFKPADFGAAGNRRESEQPAEPARAGAKRWTPDALAELKNFRASHTATETAEHFRISQTRVRQLLSPRAKPKPSPFPGTVHRMK